MYYIIDGDEGTRYESVDEVCEYIFDPDNYDDDDEVRNWIDEMYPDSFSVGGYSFSASEIIENCSSDAWSDMRYDWAQSAAESDSEYYSSEIENLDDGEDLYVRGYTVTAHDEDEEEDEEEIAEQFNSLIQTTITVKTISTSPAAVQMIK